jgi:hypothetical protein
MFPFSLVARRGRAGFQSAAREPTIYYWVVVDFRRPVAAGRRK